MTLKSKTRAEDLKNKKINKNAIDRELNEDNAYRITERLAFPRLTGTEGENKAIEIVVNEFKKQGIIQSIEINSKLPSSM